MQASFTTVELEAKRGRVVGVLHPDEDAVSLRDALVKGAEWVVRNERTLLTHEDPSAPHVARALAFKRDALRARRLKRFVFQEATSAGPRVIKMTEVQSLGNALLGVLQQSTARKEHTHHLRAMALGLAAVETRGFLEWRLGPRLLRACQVQTLLPDGAVRLDTHVLREYARFGDAAMEPLARALARAHATPFFHADLKGFHGFVTGLVTYENAPSTYDLTWIDLAHVRFGLSTRQRIINLYQALRFVVPPSPAAHRRFIAAYTQSAGWRADQAERVLEQAHAFLAYKFLTHPIA